MAWVIIILVVLVWWFWAANEGSKSEIQYQKSRIQNFIPLVESLQKLDGYFFKVSTGLNDACLLQKINNRNVKFINVSTSNDSVYIAITLVDRSEKRYYKNLKYPISINQLSMAETVKAEFLYFENNLLKTNPNFYYLKPA